jgi:hypothetical protein
MASPVKKEPVSPVISRTTTGGSGVENATPKSSFLSRRRGDSDGTNKTVVTFGNGTATNITTRPSSSPGSGTSQRTATVLIYFGRGLIVV